MIFPRERVLNIIQLIAVFCGIFSLMFKYYLQMLEYIFSLNISRDGKYTKNIIEICRSS